MCGDFRSSGPPCTLGSQALQTGLGYYLGSKCCESIFFFFNQNPSLPVKHYCILMAHFEAYICIYSLQCNFGGLTKPALHLKPHLPVGSWVVVNSRAQRCVFGCQLVSVCPLLSNAQDMVSAVFMGTISSVKSSLKLGENTFKYRFISLKQGTQPPAA